VQKIDKKILRIIDANLNRLKEGLRVCEDTCRFVLNSSSVSSNFKQVRQNITQSLKTLSIKVVDLLESRDILKDVGRKSSRLELSRKNYQEVFLANMQRVKESVRVLEEFSKIYNQKAGQYFKEIRYRIYQLEKEVMAKFRNFKF